jgi:hypothetical protein
VGKARTAVAATNDVRDLADCPTCKPITQQKADKVETENDVYKRAIGFPKPKFTDIDRFDDGESLYQIEKESLYTDEDRYKRHEKRLDFGKNLDLAAFLESLPDHPEDTNGESSFQIEKESFHSEDDTYKRDAQ